MLAIKQHQIEYEVSKGRVTIGGRKVNLDTYQLVHTNNPDFFFFMRDGKFMVPNSQVKEPDPMNEADPWDGSMKTSVLELIHQAPAEGFPDSKNQRNALGKRLLANRLCLNREKAISNIPEEIWPFIRQASDAIRRGNFDRAKQIISDGKSAIDHVDAVDCRLFCCLLTLPFSFISLLRLSCRHSYS
jgi:hypothetical protein